MAHGLRVFVHPSGNLDGLTLLPGAEVFHADWTTLRMRRAAEEASKTIEISSKAAEKPPPELNSRHLPLDSEWF